MQDEGGEFSYRESRCSDTVAADAQCLLAKLQLADRTQAAIFGLQQRLVPLDQALDD